MKSNVDLTENRAFSRIAPRDWNLVKRSMRILITGNRFVSSDKEFTKEEHLVLTGSKETRRMKRLTNDELSYRYCDCCGAYLRRFPWKFCIGLCPSCAADMDAELGRFHAAPFRRVNVGMIADGRKNPFRI